MNVLEKNDCPDPIHGYSCNRSEWRPRDIILFFLLTYALSCAQYIHFTQWYLSRIDDLYIYQQYLLDGHAHWRADMNRVLAPILIRLIQQISGHDYGYSYQHFMFWSFLVQNILASTLIVRQHMPRLYGVVLLIAFVSAPLLFFNTWWLPWTNLEVCLALCMFLLDTYHAKSHLVTFGNCLVFVAWLFTKETAVFFPIWLFLKNFFSMFEVSQKTKLPSLSDVVKMASLPLLMIIISLCITHYMRAVLWQSSTLLVGNGEGSFFDQLITVKDNLMYWARCIGGFAIFAIPFKQSGMRHLGLLWPTNPQGGIIYSIILTATLYGTIYAIKYRDAKKIALAMLSFTYLLIFLFFASFPEPDKLMLVTAMGLYWVTLGYVQKPLELNSSVIT